MQPANIPVRIILPALICAVAAVAGDSPDQRVNRKEHLASFQKLRADADAALARDPDNADWLTRRGDARLFMGDAKGAVADFEKEVSIQPVRDAPHWRLGIAYYFAGDFAKSVRQFEKYHAYDGRDRENGVWHFLANARVVGIEKARAAMLKYTRFDRHPFPAIYEMLAGKKSGPEVLAEMKEQGLDKDALAMFFAHYYIGLNEDILGHRDFARKHLGEAMACAEKAATGGGPGYMLEVARLHDEAFRGK